MTTDWRETVQVLHWHDEPTRIEARGHVDTAEFDEWVARYCEDEGLPEPLPCKHIWQRIVPDRSGEYTGLHVEAEPYARGAYRATVAEL